MSDLRESIHRTLNLQEQRPPKASVNALVKAYSKKLSGAKGGAPIKTQQRFHNAFFKKYDSMVKKYPNVDMTSDSFWRGLEKQANAMLRKKVGRGPGSEW